MLPPELAAQARARAHRGRRAPRRCTSRSTPRSRSNAEPRTAPRGEESNGARIAEEDPQRGLGGPPGQRQDVRERGTPVRGGRDQPAWLGGRRNHGLGLGLRREGARDVDLREPLLVPLGRPQDQPRSTRPASPASSPTRWRRCASCEGAVFVVNGVMGVEVTTSRLWERAAELGLARIVFVNMLDRERADFFRTLDSLKQAFGQHVVATEIPIGSEHELQGVIDLIDMKAFRYDGDGRDNCEEIEIPEELQRAGPGVPREADGRGGRGLRRADGALPRGRGDLPRGDRRRAQDGRDRGAPVPGHLRRRHAQPRHQPPARRVRRGPAVARQEGRRRAGRAHPRARRVEGHGRVRLQDARRPVRRPHQPLPRLPGRAEARLAGVQLPRATCKERIGQLLVPQGKEHRARRRVRPRRHRRRGQAQGDARRRRARLEGRWRSRSSCRRCRAR